MYLMYIDESGDTGLVNSPTNFFYLTGLVIHELRWKDALNSLIDFRRRMAQTYGLRMRQEVHAAELIGKGSKSEYAHIPKHHRLAILRNFADQIANIPDISIINIVVDKRNRPVGYDVFENAWKTLIQRLENTINHKNFPGPNNPDERGMIFPDNTDRKRLRNLMRKMRYYNIVPGIHEMPARNLQLTLTIEDPNHRDSKDSYFIQAADNVVYLLRQYVEPNKYMKAKGGNNYFKKLDIALCKVASRNNPMGIVRL